MMLSNLRIINTKMYCELNCSVTDAGYEEFKLRSETINVANQYSWNTVGLDRKAVWGERNKSQLSDR